MGGRDGEYFDFYFPIAFSRTPLFVIPVDYFWQSTYNSVGSFAVAAYHTDKTKARILTYPKMMGGYGILALGVG